MLKLVHVFVVIVVCCSVVQSQTTRRTTTKQPATTFLKSTISTTSKSTARTTTRVTTKTTTRQSTNKPATSTQRSSTAATVSTILPTISTYKMCSDTNSTATSGIIQPLANVTIENSNYCDFTIIVPSDQLVQFSCSVLNFTSAASLTISGAVDYDANFQLVPNRVYNSWINEIQLRSRGCHSDCWFDCKWTKIPVPPPNMTDFKMCRYAETTTAIGTIQSIDDDTGPPRTCPFFINAPTNYQVQLSCSVLNFTDTFPQVLFEIFYALDDFNQKPVENRVYTSLKNQMFLYFYRPVNIDWFRCNWTTVPIPASTMTDFRLCRHGEARTADGTIQPLINDLTGPPRDCIFSIIAPVDQFLSISCSFANFTSARNFVRLSGIAYTDTFVSKLSCARPEVGQVYTSVDNRIDLSARIENGNWFKCNWTTTTIGPTPTTTQNGIYKLCRDTNSTAANGTIQPLSFSAASGGCSFTIQAPPNQRIQLSCSVIDGMSLRVVGAVINTLSPTSYIDAGVNRVYTSLENQLQLTSTNVNSSGWIDCKWTTIPAISDNATKFELCRDKGTEKPSGTIQVPDWEPGNKCSDVKFRICSFTITVPADYRVQLSCPAIKNVNGYYLLLDGVIEYSTGAGYEFPLFENRIYTSVSNRMSLLSQVGDPHWLFCNWTMIPKKMTTDFKFCLDSEATSASGTIQPLDRYTGKPRVCPFTINALRENLIIFSCSVVNLTSDSSSFKIEGTAEMINRPITNTIYVSTGNQMKISSTIVNSDWFMCKWTAVKPFRACQDRRTNATDGIIQPVEGLANEPRMCLFTITVPSGQRVQMSCTDVNLNGMTSSLEFAEEQNNVAAHEPMVNTIYTSKSNRIFITAVVNATDWFSCQWTTI